MVSRRSCAVFFRTLGLFFKGGIPVHRALDLLSRDTDDPAMARVSGAVATRLDRGESLSQAMAAHSEVFSGLQARLVKVGEVSGSLNVVLMRLSEFEEKQLETAAKARTALVYPAVLFVMCMLMVTLLPPYLFGGLYPLIESSGVEVWWLTRWMMAFSQALNSTWFYGASAVAVLLSNALLRKLWTRPGLRRRGLALLLKIPFLGRVLTTLAVTRFTRALTLMIQVGVPVVQALELAGQSSGNEVLEERTPAAIRTLINGATLAVSLKTTEFFPKMMLMAITVGQDSGALGDVLEKVTELYEVQLEHDFELLASMAEPLVLALMGGVVGLITIATLVPLIQVIQKL